MMLNMKLWTSLTVVSNLVVVSAGEASLRRSNQSDGFDGVNGLAACEVGCASHADCELGLNCYVGDVSSTVTPDCAGVGSLIRSGSTFCYEPFAGELSLNGWDREPATNFPLKECQGSCDNDRDCDYGLVCHQPMEGETVPGCLGASVSGQSYCRKASESELVLKQSGPFGQCEGGCFSDEDCAGEMMCFIRVREETVPGCTGEGVHATNYCVDGYYRETSPLRKLNSLETVKLGHCEGICDDDEECESNHCFHRYGFQEVPGCIGEGEENGSYCVDDVHQTASEHPDAFSLEECDVGCESDIHCKSNLKCMIRSGAEAVEGCAGLEDGENVCYTPKSNELVHVSNNEQDEHTLALCQGDCDDDVDCQIGLVCYERIDNEAIPHGRGCVEGDSGTLIPREDYCVLPLPGQLTIGDTSQEGTKLARCEGDCNSDSDCDGSLKCFQRGHGDDRFAEVHGCVGTGVAGYDYCYDPEDAPKEPTTSPTATPSDLPTTPPTANPTGAPSETPTDAPTATPSETPTRSPTAMPSEFPTVSPTGFPTMSPTVAHSANPTATVTSTPTDLPTDSPTSSPTDEPTQAPTEKPEPLGRCGVGCQDDSDCLNGMKCKIRFGSETVPRCDVSAPALDGKNMCYAEMGGNCDVGCQDDGDCRGAAKCMARTGAQAVPKCDTTGKDGMNMCYTPLINTCKEGCKANSDCKTGDCFKVGKDGKVPGCRGKFKKGKGVCWDKPQVGKCALDCEDDDDCKGTLRCFIRDVKNKQLQKAKVPGCPKLNSKSFGKNVCYKKPLIEECGVDCESDIDCASGLICNVRTGKSPVPFCRTGGKDGKNMCSKKPLNSCRFGCEKNADCAGDMQCLDRSVDVAARAPFCPFQSTDKGKNQCHKPILEECGVGCTSNLDCEGELRCMKRSAAPDKEVPGCSNPPSGENVCYLWVTDAPTESPTSAPTAAPDLDFESGGLKLGECDPGCESDIDCKPSLYCHQRTAMQWVPGCGKLASAFRGLNACAKATEGTLVFQGDDSANSKKLNTRSIPQSGNWWLNRCEGDCDTDWDCDKGLLCMEREAKEPVPGCSGSGVYEYDYCYDPKNNKDFAKEKATLIIANDGNGNLGLDVCEGDCDSDSQCKSGLVCFQREDDYGNGNAAIPHCNGKGTKNVDYCVKQSWLNAKYKNGDYKLDWGDKNPHDPH